MKRQFDKRYAYIINERDIFQRYQMHEIKPKRLNKCQAWMYETDNGLIWLKSYNTIVAVYSKGEDILYVIGRYSATTYQHVRKFRNQLPNYWNTPEINLEYENWYN